MLRSGGWADRERYCKQTGHRGHHRSMSVAWFSQNPVRRTRWWVFAKGRRTVSYTHLTLPTICSV
eukprot:11721323-Alexandrium_andersonii.AAC.1